MATDAWYPQLPQKISGCPLTVAMSSKLCPFGSFRILVITEVRLVQEIESIFDLGFDCYTKYIINKSIFAK